MIQSRTQSPQASCQRVVAGRDSGVLESLQQKLDFFLLAVDCNKNESRVSLVKISLPHSLPLRPPADQAEA